MWDVDAVRKLSEIEPDAENPNGSQLAFSPTEPILTQIREHYFTKTEILPGGGTSTDYEGIREQSVVFWNPLNGERIGQVDCRDETCRDIGGNGFFSPDGRRLYVMVATLGAG